MDMSNMLLHVAEKVNGSTSGKIMKYLNKSQYWQLIYIEVSHILMELRFSTDQQIYQGITNKLRSQSTYT